MVEHPDPTEKTADDVEPQPPRDELLQSILNPTCDLCGSRMIEHHCRLFCPMCGYQRDCSDP